MNRALRSGYWGKYGRGERGATMVEFALVFGVVLLLVLMIIDFSRYVFALNTATHASRRILDRAKSDAAITRDIRGEDTVEPKENFHEARDRILSESLGASGLASSADPGRGQAGSLATYELPDPINPGATLPRYGLLLLPGETAVRRSEGAETLINHPTCVRCDEYLDVSKNGYDLLTARHGMYAQVAVELPLLVMGGRKILVIGDALSWEEVHPAREQGQLLGTAEPTQSCSTIPRDEACAAVNCDVQREYCYYYAERFTPDCAVCKPRSCLGYWQINEYKTGISFCDAIGCTEPGACRFNGERLLSEVADPEHCGDCQGALRCKDLTTSEEACAAKACGIGMLCQFQAQRRANDTANCAFCRPQRCGSYITEEAACAAAGCEAQGKDCYYKAWVYGNPCAVCVPRDCERPRGGCGDGNVWSGMPLCTCCRYQTCAGMNNSGTGERYQFDSRTCRCTKIPDDSTGDPG